MDGWELREPVPGQGEAAGPEGVAPEHRGPVRAGRDHAGVLVPARRQGKVGAHVYVYV